MKTYQLLIASLLFCLNLFAQKKPTILKTGKQDTLATREWVRQHIQSLAPQTNPSERPPITPVLPTETVTPPAISHAAYECIWLGGLDRISYNGETLLACEKKTAIDNWKNDGGSAIQITVDWQELEQSAGSFRQDSKQKLLSVLNYLRSQNMKAYIKLHMTISHLQCFDGCPEHLYDIYSDGVRTPQGNYQNGGGIPMTLSSPKISNMERYWLMMSKLLLPYKDMIFLSVTNEPNQELQYVIDAVTDYHPLEEQSWQSWQQRTYRNSLGSQPTDFYNEIGRRWMRFKSANLVAFAKKWGKAFADFNTIYDCGSFSDNLILRGNWGVPTDDLKPEIKGLKDNPDFWGNYDIELISSITTSYNPDLNLLETTYNPQQNVGDNANRIVHEIERAKAGGVKIINFSFFSNYHDTSSPNYQTGTQVMKRLKEKGLLSTTTTKSYNCPAITLYSSKALQSGGFMGAYSGQYKQAIQSCEGKPKVKIINDL